MDDLSAREITDPDRSRRAALQLILAAGGLSVAGLAESAGTNTSGNSDSLLTEIDAVLRRTEDLWNSQDFFRLKEVWDGDDPEPWYVPEEIETPFRSWPEIEKYWSPGRRVLRAFRWRFSNLHVKSVAPDLALALFDHFYEIDVAIGPPTPPTAGFDRVLAIFRRKEDGWKHILYAQCPLGPDSYIKALRQKIVQPDFKAFSERTEAEYRERNGAGSGGKPRP
ncbi:MAG: hypothetical protein ABI661_07180 [Gammaproteobacteria bacterium]